MTKDEIKKMVNTCNNYYSCALCPYNPEDISRFIGDRWKGGCPDYDRKLVYAMGKGYGNISEYEAEIDGLKAENEKLTKVVLSKVYDFVNKIIEETNTRLDIENQAKIDVLNELKEKYGFYSCYSFKNDVKSLSEIIDELLKEYENE